MIVDDECCPDCGAGADNLYCSEDNQEWLDEERLCIWHTYRCAKCGLTFKGNSMFQLVSRIIGHSKEDVNERIIGE